MRPDLKLLIKEPLSDNLCEYFAISRVVGGFLSVFVI